MPGPPGLLEPLDLKIEAEGGRAPNERLKLLQRRRRGRMRWEVEGAKCQVRLTPV